MELSPNLSKLRKRCMLKKLFMPENVKVIMLNIQAQNTEQKFKRQAQTSSSNSAVNLGPPVSAIYLIQSPLFDKSLLYYAAVID